MVNPSGTVTFLFTDIEGSTQRWEADPDAMRAALTGHDAVLRSAIEAQGGWLFKHTGDGVCAAFASAPAALTAAVEAQRHLALPVRMGLATGEAEDRGDDYLGPVLNRVARVMAAGHGGQILVASSTAALLPGVTLLDLGEHRLRDLSGTERLYQVVADGLGDAFPPLRTMDTTPGNVTQPPTSFVGRDAEVREVAGLLRAHRLVTLTGVGGVGKTRLALQVAAGMVAEFPDGIWLVELAPVGDRQAVADAVAGVLGVTTSRGSAPADTIARTLSGRRVLIVVDNCEHLLDASADLVETVLARTTTTTVLATSREGLRVDGEQVWPVPSLGTDEGSGSAAVELFVERARSVNPTFELGDPTATEAVIEICRRLDGIALAIELAAARMASMGPQDVRDRLSDRFRLLAGSRRGLERHQTLRHAVGWSYDLLDDDERAVLNRCSVFSGGFDLDAVAHLCRDAGFDEYRVVDLVDSLVRKSLVTTEQAGGRARYGMLETVRQFAEEQLATTAGIGRVRDDHASFYAQQIVEYWQSWDGPDQRIALEWVDVELANLRAAFRWAMETSDVVGAATIAAHTALVAVPLQRFEPSAWSEEILPAAISAGVPYLPRLYVAASYCGFTGRPLDAVEFAEAAFRLQDAPGYEPIEARWTRHWEANANGLAGRVDPQLAIYDDLAGRDDRSRTVGLCGLTWVLPAARRAAEATALAEEAVAAARADGNPFLISWALHALARAFINVDPARALGALRDGLRHNREQRQALWQAVMARDAARLEAAHGEPDDALALADASIDALHGAGDVINLTMTLANLAGIFQRLGRPDVAATLYGFTQQHPTGDLLRVAELARAELGEERFRQECDAGAAMELAQAVRHARSCIDEARGAG